MTQTANHTNNRNALIIKDTHRALWHEDGDLKRVLEGGRYPYPKRRWFEPFKRLPRIEVVLVDIRQRDLTIKGQEILTSDKVAIRVSIVVRYRVTDPQAAVQNVTDYEGRIYTDVQLAARRSLSSMTLEAILKNRNELNEDILAEVTESATSFGVEVLRADVKDLIFPGNLQTIMNRVLSAERMAEAQLIEARAKADVEAIDAQSRADKRRIDAESAEEEQAILARAEAEAERVRTEAEIRDLQARAEAAAAYSEHPVLLRMLELEAMQSLSESAKASLYIKFDKWEADGKGETE
jgi:regulator of protease activity HflC (stomatin/prohibitin superfamily)